MCRKMKLISLFILLMATHLEANPSAYRGKIEVEEHGQVITPLTVKDFDNLWKVWEPELKEKASFLSTEGRRELFDKRYGFVRKNLSEPLPFGFVATTGNIVKLNCLLCHSSSVEGTLIAGASNPYLDLRTFFKDVKKASTITAPAFDLLAQSASATRGNINAFLNVANLFKLRNADLDLTPFIQFYADDFKGMAVDVPVWWTLKGKKRLFYDSSFTYSPRLFLAVADTFLPGRMLRAKEDQYWDILEYAASTLPPKYPFVINQVKATNGATVFHNTCVKCHGTSDNFPEKVVPLNVVKTDPARLNSEDGIKFKKFYSRGWVTEGYPVIVNSGGYLAPSLKGIWASAPYFHNGSVPTLYNVLFPETRPLIWKAKDRPAYDREKVGLAFESFESFPNHLIRYDFEHGHYYDTNEFGQSKDGHNFAQKLSVEERMDLLEYLKTL